MALCTSIWHQFLHMRITANFLFPDILGCSNKVGSISSCTEKKITSAIHNPHT